MYFSKLNGIKRYELTWFMFFAIIFGLVLLLATVGMLISILAVGVNTMKSVNPETVSHLLSSSLPSDEIEAAIKQSLKNILKDGELLGPITKQISDLLDAKIAEFMQQQANMFAFSKLDKKSLPGVCHGISDEGLCRDTQGTCDMLSACVRTMNTTTCQRVGMSLHNLCLKI